VRRLSFFVEGRAVSFREAYGAKRRPSAEAIAWRNTIAWEYQLAARKAAGLPYDGSYTGAVGLLIEAWGTAADWDNIGKEVSDALEGSAYVNDRQVCNARVKFPGRLLTAKGGIARAPEDDTAGVYITIVWFDIPG
jgi:hypothetical protein